jgi:hypothetical protein
MSPQCLSLLRNQDQSAHYCLTLKIWNEPCPPRCPRRIDGPPGQLEKVETHGYDIDCVDMIRKTNQQNFFCKLYDLAEPFCTDCPYARYAVELVAELKLNK